MKTDHTNCIPEYFEYFCMPNVIKINRYNFELAYIPFQNWCIFVTQCISISHPRVMCSILDGNCNIIREHFLAIRPKHLDYFIFKKSKFRAISRHCMQQVCCWTQVSVHCGILRYVYRDEVLSEWSVSKWRHLPWSDRCLHVSMLSGIRWRQLREEHHGISHWRRGNMWLET